MAKCHIDECVYEITIGLFGPFHLVHFRMMFVQATLIDLKPVVNGTARFNP